jgi:ATP-dependent DNA helicase RecQ
VTEEKSRVLKEHFGYTVFRPGQEEVIDAILAGRDVLAVMPTGAGKSLCYQIPAMLLPGTTVVVSPLISLMKYQVQSLIGAGIPAAFLNSSLSPGEYSRTMEQISGGAVKLLYIAPERLQRMDIISSINRGNHGNHDNRGEVPLVVVDEAHCVSQWGHDFRPSYLDIAGFIDGFSVRPVTAAFTATATPKVKENIRELLRLKADAFSITSGFDRPNLLFEVQKPRDKNAALLTCLEERKDSSGIVYCATRKAVEDIHSLLLGRGFAVTRYHAGLEDAERRRNQDDFLHDRKTVMIATNAFGMGINKPNVSFVIHYNMPKNIESYYQEAGRAGRDGEKADCVLLYSGQDVRINEYLITHGEEGEETDPALLAHNCELLKQMTFYATGSGCLRHKLLSYFGETSPAFCGNCSSCLTEYKETDITLEARKIISCVFRLKERNKTFGKVMIIDILRGSKNEKILRLGFDKLSVWGIMAETEAHRIRVILDHLIDEGWLSQEQVQSNRGDKYPVVTIGRALDLLREEKRLFMMLPEEREAKTERSGKPSVQAETKFPKKHTPDFDRTLFERLRELRMKIALKENLPAFVVFSDASLRDMCYRKPVSLVQFSAVNGVGSAKLEKYGDVFTGLISDYLGTR